MNIVKRINNTHNPIYCDSDIIDDYFLREVAEILDEEYECLIKEKAYIDLFFERDDFLQEYLSIPIIISGECPSERYYMGRHELAEMISVITDSFQGNIEEKTLLIETALKNQSITEKVLGTYHHDGCPELEGDDRPYIKIYYGNCNKKSNKTLRASLSNCLAHEYFHYYHDCNASKQFNTITGGWEDKCRERVIESLADYFSAVYTLALASHRNYYLDAYIQYIEKEYHTWMDRLGSNWPYAYAYCFYSYNGKPLDFSSDYKKFINDGRKKLFCEVFDASKASMTEAYYILSGGLPEYYKII